MEVIDGMTDDEFDRVCAAGAKLIEQLVHVLRNSGFDIDQAPNVLAVAVAGIAKGLNLDPAKYAASFESLKTLWRLERRSDGGHGIVFDPPHLRPDFVPAVQVVSESAN